MPNRSDGQRRKTAHVNFTSHVPQPQVSSGITFSKSISLTLYHFIILFWRRKIGYASEVQQLTSLTSNK